MISQLQRGLLETPAPVLHGYGIKMANAQRITRGSERRFQVLARDSEHDSLVVLPVFPASTVLLPTGQGMLRAFEPKYTATFQRLSENNAGDGQKARFLHVLSPSASPPAMLEGGVKGFPAVGCAARIDAIQSAPDGSLIVRYTGDRRVRLRFMEPSEGGDGSLTAAGTWHDDMDPETFVAVGSPPGTASAALDGLEREVAAIVNHIARLSRRVQPEKSAIPEAISTYSPPNGGARTRPTSYDALKAAGHQAATAIDMWRRHGSVYGSKGPSSRQVHADPYTQLSEELGKARRQELFSFAVAQLLDMGTPETCALLLSQDTAGRLSWILEAIRPYLMELQATAAVQGALNEHKK